MLRLALAAAAVPSAVLLDGPPPPSTAADLPDPMAPQFHFYPDFDGPVTPSPQSKLGLKANTWSQDISGPIAVEVNGTLHYHVFVDCIPPGSPCKSCPIKWGTPLEWCHFSSANMVAWQQHPIAIAPDRDFDGAIIDTGSVFQVSSKALSSLVLPRIAV
eukprot:SAG22_NODE_342_length_11973_cov_10.127927_13_plen_159_part_00